jgi:hypothetical protein
VAAPLERAASTNGRLPSHFLGRLGSKNPSQVMPAMTSFIPGRFLKSLGSSKKPSRPVI